MENKDICSIVRHYELSDIVAIEKAYPSATFILTERQVDDWYGSFVKHFGKIKGCEDMVEYKHKGYYCDSFYTKFMQDIKTHFYGREWKLFTVKMGDTEIWSKMCAYLSKPIPKKPYPHKNKSK